MNQVEFDKVLNNRIVKIQDVLSTKAGEYASQRDRLHNFKIAAQLSSRPTTPEQALWGMLRKHLVSVIDMIEDTASGITPSPEKRDEKINDTINYLILLEALFVEREWNDAE